MFVWMMLGFCCCCLLFVSYSKPIQCEDFITVTRKHKIRLTFKDQAIAWSRSPPNTDDLVLACCRKEAPTLAPLHSAYSARNLPFFVCMNIQIYVYKRVVKHIYAYGMSGYMGISFGWPCTPSS